MITEKINLTEDGRVHMVTYIRDQSAEMKHSDTRPAMLVIPGGGYGMTSDREAEPIALAFLNKGYNCFVLRYSVGEYAKYPAPLIDASKAIMMIRRNAELWNIFPGKISVCGFSAGGHLAAMTATLWNNSEVQAELGINGTENRPDSVILSYPVITNGSHAHRGSFDNLIGTEPLNDMLALTSLETQVGAHTPPVFLWHTANDDAVPVENSLLMAGALSANKIKFALHIFAEGPHGLALATEETGHHCPDSAKWVDLASEWLKSL